MKEALVFSRDRVGEEHQQVDVRVKTELLAAVAAEREDADRLADQPGVGKELLDEGVHALRVALERDPSALAPLGGGRQLVARRVEALGTRRVGFDADLDLGCLRISHRQQLLTAAEPAGSLASGGTAVS